MATTTEGPRKTYKAGADLSAKQFFIVKQGADEATIVLAAAATDFILGTLENKPKSGENASVFLRGVGGATAKVSAGGAITEGDFLTTDASGEAVATTTLGDEVFGRALQAGDDGDIIEYVPYAGKYAEIV